MRSLFCKTLLAIAVSAIGAFAADNTIGQWKLNVEKSKYTPAPMPLKNLTITRDAADGGVKVTTAGERTDGTSLNATYTTKYDGSDVQVAGNSLYDTVAIKQVNANTLTEARKKTDGPYKATSRIVVSSGGKIMTITTTGTNAEGKEFTSVFVFDKQ
jgi:hypothetical protein